MELLSGKPPTDFIGYGHELTAQAKVICLIQESRSVQEVKAPAAVEVILDRSPFYGEAGGQVGDTGLLAAADGKVRVGDTQWVGSVLVHRGELAEGRVRVGDRVDAGVDADRRRRTAQNHTATHLLHAALRRVLGEHVMQAGSLVAPDHLRLDFSHGRGLTPQQRESVESLVNEWVEKNYPVRVDKMAIDEAKKTGATALFGEKYGSEVRVVSIGDVSRELCGGTHLKGSGDVGLLTIVEEGSIASGIRRIEALSDQTALDSLKAEVVRLRQERERLMERNSQLGGKNLFEDKGDRLVESPVGRLALESLKAETARLREDNGRLEKQGKQLEKEIQHLKAQDAQAQARNVSAKDVGPFHVYFQKFSEPMGPAVLRSCIDMIQKTDPQAVISIADSTGCIVAGTGGTAQQKGISAKQVIDFWTALAGGSGGGREGIAQGHIEKLGFFSMQKFEQFFLGRAK